MRPVVSAIIPNYNHARFLERRIASVLDQSYSDVEVILLDDCSTDGSRAIIDRYRDHPRVTHVVYNSANSGSAFAQWSKGIELAQGDWIWIAESDDYSHEDFLATVATSARQDEAVVLAYCQSNIVDERDTVLGTMEKWTKDVDPHRWSSDYVNLGMDEIATALIFKNTIPNASAVLFKKSAVLGSDDSYRQMRFCGDWLLWVNILREGKVAYTARPLNFFRKHAGTTRQKASSGELKRRLEEEYAVLMHIRHDLGLDPQQLESQLRHVAARYGHCFTKRELARFVVSPGRYDGPLPLSSVVVSYVLKRARNIPRRARRTLFG